MSDEKIGQTNILYQWIIVEWKPSECVLYGFINPTQNAPMSNQTKNAFTIISNNIKHICHNARSVCYTNENNIHDVEVQIQSRAKIDAFLEMNTFHSIIHIKLKPYHKWKQISNDDRQRNSTIKWQRFASISHIFFYFDSFIFPRNWHEGEKRRKKILYLSFDMCTFLKACFSIFFS